MRSPCSAYGLVYLFQGGRYDTATGLYNFRHRDLSPVLGRWLQPDPLGFAGGDSNLYRYVSNGPGNTTDPSGLAETRVVLTPMTEEQFWKFLGVAPPKRVRGLPPGRGSPRGLLLGEGTGEVGPIGQ